MAKSNFRVLWHTLYFETQYPKIIHHTWHTGRNHTQILAAKQHIGCRFQNRELFHGFTAPELLVAFIEIIKVYFVDNVLAMIVEFLVRPCKMERVPREKCITIGSRSM